MTVPDCKTFYRATAWGRSAFLALSSPHTLSDAKACKLAKPWSQGSFCNSQYFTKDELVFMPYTTDITTTMAVFKQHVVEYKQLVSCHVTHFFGHSLLIFQTKMCAINLWTMLCDVTSNPKLYKLQYNNRAISSVQRFFVLLLYNLDGSVNDPMILQLSIWNINTVTDLLQFVKYLYCNWH